MAQGLATMPVIMGREAYRHWAAEQPGGRYERVAGVVVAMAPQRGAHLRIKAAVWLALRQAIVVAGVGCQALPDGATVEIDDATDYEPDAVVNCGEPMAADAVAAPNPVVVVEVLSPSTQSVDTGAKLADYFRVPSIRHYLIVRTDRCMVVHHWRREDGGIEARLVAAGRIELNPPGIGVSVDDFYAP